MQCRIAHDTKRTAAVTVVPTRDDNDPQTYQQSEPQLPRVGKLKFFTGCLRQGKFRGKVCTDVFERHNSEAVNPLFSSRHDASHN